MIAGHYGVVLYNQAKSYNTTVLQGVQKTYQRRIISPMRAGRSFRMKSVSMCQNLGLRLKIDFGVDVGCVNRNMAQPCADGVDIDSGAKKTSGRRMPDGVGTDRPVRKCRQRARDDADVLADHPMNTMPGYGLAQPV